MDLVWISFKKSAQKIQRLLKSDKNDTYFTYRSMYIYDEMTFNYFYKIILIDNLTNLRYTRILYLVTFF